MVEYYDAEKQYYDKGQARHKGSGRVVYRPKNAANDIPVPREQSAMMLQSAPYDTSITGNRISRELIISKCEKPSSVDRNKELISEWIRGSKEIYSETSILPEALKEFTYPMSECLVKQRRASVNSWIQEKKEEKVNPAHPEYIEEEYSPEDNGIVEGHIEEKTKPQWNAPLWFQNNTSFSDRTAKNDGEAFTLESLSKRQLTLEEEKRIFFESKEVKPLHAPVVEKPLQYSSMDALFEQKPTGVAAIFAAAPEEIHQTAKIKAIDLSTLEANMMSQKKVEATVGKNMDDKGLEEGEEFAEQDNSEGEELPVWSKLTAEEIQKESKERIDSWGVSGATKPLLDNKDEAVQGFAYNHNKEPATKVPSNIVDWTPEQLTATIQDLMKEPPNPFTINTLTESDQAWYYKDLQGFVRGPFSCLNMHRWHKANYFPPDLLIRLGEDNQFISLDSFLATGRTAPPSYDVYRQRPQHPRFRPDFPEYMYTHYEPSHLFNNLPPAALNQEDMHREQEYTYEKTSSSPVGRQELFPAPRTTKAKEDSYENTNERSTEDQRKPKRKGHETITAKDLLGFF